MTSRLDEGLSVRSYFAVIVRWKWLIIALTVVIGLVGAAYAWTRTPLYSATAQLLYVQQVDIGNPLGGATVDQNLQQADIGSVPAVVSSTQVNSAAAQFLSSKDTSAGYSTSATLQTDANGTGYLSVVGIQGVSAHPQTAADAANAYAKAFIAWRRDSARAQVNQAILAVQSSLRSYTTASSRTTSDYLALQQRLQDLQLLQQSVTGDFSIISPAYPPSVPFSPRKTRSLAIAVILGFVLGTGLAFLLEQLNTRVRDEEQVVDLLGMSALGHLPPPTRGNGAPEPVQMLVNPFGMMAEAVRVLRGNLDFMGVDGEIHSLLVSSSIQGEGKSMTACNLAVSMALAGKRVVLVDADLRRPRVHTYMSVANSVGLSSVIARHAQLSDALVSITLDKAVGASADPAVARGVRVRDAAVRVFSTPGPERSGDVLRGQQPSWSGWPASPDDNPVLRVLPSGPPPPNPGEMVASRRFAEIVDELADDADLVLIDTPAMLSVGDTAAMAAKADGLVFVVNTALVRRPMLERSQAQLAKLPCRKLGLVIISSQRGKDSYYYGYHYHTHTGSEPGRRSSKPA